MNDDDKILIVDDDEAIARLLSEILRSEGFSTRECLSGPAAPGRSRRMISSSSCSTS